MVRSLSVSRSMVYRKMFIGGLNWETDDSESQAHHECRCFTALLMNANPDVIDSLQTYFSQFGRVASSSIMRDPTGRSRGFAFLTFEDPASVNTVMVKEHVLDGKIVSVNEQPPSHKHRAERA
jgi:RNA-binding protein Musashi